MVHLPITFGKKRRPPSARAPAAERVRALSQQGYSEPEIIRALRTEGYSPGEADVAMREALRTAALPGPAQRPAPARDMFSEPAPLPGQAWQFPERRPAFQEERPALPELPELPEEEEVALPRRRAEPRRDMEEIAEGVVEEKWSLFERDLEDLAERIKQMDQRLLALESAVTEFKGVKKGDVEQIKQAIDSYKDSMGDLSARIEGMERAVKDSLTPMMQSLRSLSDTLRAMKTGK